MNRLWPICLERNLFYQCICYSFVKADRGPVPVRRLRSLVYAESIQIKERLFVLDGLQDLFVCLCVFFLFIYPNKLTFVED